MCRQLFGEIVPTNRRGLGKNKAGKESKPVGFLKPGTAVGFSGPLDGALRKGATLMHHTLRVKVASMDC